MDLAVTLAVGGDCLADVALLRGRAGRVRAGGLGSDGVAHDRGAGGGRAGRAERDRRRPGRRRGHGRGGWPGSTRRTTTPAPRTPLVIDVDATLVTAHSEKEQAAADVQEAGSGSTRCARSSTTAARGPGSRWRSCCARATPARTPRRPHHRDPGRAATAARAPARDPARPQGAGPHRRRRRHPRPAGLAARPTAVVLGRVHPPRAHPRPARTRSPRRRGSPPTTPTTRSATGPGWPS